MTFLTRELILRHRPPRYEDVPVPELGDNAVARIQALSGNELDRFLGSLWIDGKYNRQNYAEKLVTLTWVDESGKRVLQDGDVVGLGQQDGAMIQRLALVAERLNGLQVKQVESAAGN